MLKKIPLYNLISQKILQDIHSGKFKEVLPTEQELTLCYGVSRPTIRSALQKLNEDNIVKTIHGRGTFVTQLAASPHMRIDKLKGYYPLLLEGGYHVSLEEAGHTEVAALPVASDVSGHSLQGPFVLIRRLLRCDDVPAIYIEEYIPKTELKSGGFDQLPTSIYDIASQFLKQQIKYTVSVFSPLLAPPHIVKSFALKEPQPIFLVKETHFNMLDNPIIFSQVFINNIDKINLTVIRTS